MLITKKVEITINNRHVKYYRNKGYDIKGGDTILVNITDLSKQSHVKVLVQCDICGQQKEIKYYNYTENIERNNKYICNNCKGTSIINSNLKKYGVRSTLELPEVQEKIKKTLKERYGVEHYSKSDEFKIGIFNKFGVKSSLLLDDVKKKTVETLRKKYGVEHYSKSDEFKNKLKDAMHQHYGCHYSQTDEFKEKIRNITLEKMKKRLDDYEILDYNDKIIKIKCKKCGEFEIHRELLKTRLKYKTEICTNCNKINSFSSSGNEIKLQDFIKSVYSGDIITNSKNIIKPLELDIYLPGLKLAFEYNGLYWHNELRKEKNYHLEKTEKCEEAGIQLVHVYEDDWICKREIVKSRILNLLRKTPNKIYARNCVIKEVSTAESRIFLDKNHIQGFIGSKIKIGLYFKDELVSIMCVGKRRIGVGRNDDYELLRFCNKLNTNVIGGASKLFKYLKNYDINRIVSYVDRSWSNGNLYEKLGFKLINKTIPNYYYIIDGIRHHRFNFRKDKLVKEGYDINKSEHQIMIDRNISRIYDSGSLVYELTIKISHQFRG
jgi:transcription elongation factor Elf1